MGLIYLGGGRVGGALAAHEVGPVDEGEPAPLPLSGVDQVDGHVVEDALGVVAGDPRREGGRRLFDVAL